MPALCVFLVCLSDRCQEVDSEEQQRKKREDKCPFLENSGSEEDVLQILQYMATILGKKIKESKMCMYVCLGMEGGLHDDMSVSD